MISRGHGPEKFFRLVLHVHVHTLSLWKKSRLNSTFFPYRVKKYHSTLEMDTFKVMLILPYLASLDNKPYT